MCVRLSESTGRPRELSKGEKKEKKERKKKEREEDARKKKYVSLFVP